MTPYNSTLSKRLRTEIGIPKLLWFVFLQKTKLLNLFPKKKQASMFLPLLTIILEEDPQGFISEVQNLGDKIFPVNPKDLKKKGAEGIWKEVLEFLPILEPYKMYFLNYLKNKEKELIGKDNIH